MQKLDSSLRRAFSIDNLERSWRWLNSSAKYDYKNFFRNHYKAYGLSVSDNLKDLQKRLRYGVYTPSYSTKIYLPKKSGILRPFSLLNTEDQIVYQAMINVIAEKLYPKAKGYYNELNFGNQYATSHSKFFFKKWQNGYSLFNKSIKQAYSQGLDVTATFDLTAFYDSIDHNILSQFLKELGLSAEFNNFLIVCLQKWSCHGRNRMIQGHGIPQGPMTSGLLGEVVLNIVDEEFSCSGLDVKYFRYVDDIRLMSSNENSIKRALIELDVICKSIGLFPQTSKIEVHKIFDIESEVKSVSTDPDLREIQDSIDSHKALCQLQQIIRNNKVHNETNFKYIIGRAEYGHRLSNKLLKILNKQPHLYDTILRYFEKYDRFSLSLSKSILHSMKKNCLYEEVTSRYLRCLQKRLHPQLNEDVVNFCLDYFKNFDSLKSPTLKSTILSYVFSNLHIKYIDLEKIINTSDEWIRQNIMHWIDKDVYGEGSYTALINSLLCKEDTDTALNAASLCIIYDLDIKARTETINPLAQNILFALGKIKTRRKASCSISSSLSYLLGITVGNIDWRSFFSEHHKKCEQDIFMCRTYIQTDSTALINQLDVFNDFALNSLFIHNVSLGKYKLGHIGSVKESKRLAQAYPKFYKLCNYVHELRYESSLSHPLVKNTKKHTRRITFNEIKRHKKLFVEGYLELSEAVKNSLSKKRYRNIKNALLQV